MQDQKGVAQYPRQQDRGKSADSVTEKKAGAEGAFPPLRDLIWRCKLAAR